MEMFRKFILRKLFGVVLWMFVPLALLAMVVGLGLTVLIPDPKGYLAIVCFVLSSAVAFSILFLLARASQHAMRPKVTYRYKFDHECTLPNRLTAFFGSKAALKIKVDLHKEERGQSVEWSSREFTRKLTKQEFLEYEKSQLPFVENLAKQFLISEFGSSVIPASEQSSAIAIPETQQNALLEQETPELESDQEK